jgi:catechol 2,3-dioxygenase-like lactoylglutathione lyase family enzyme
MFDHVTIRVAARDRSRDFYETVLAPLEREISSSGEGFDEWNDFSIAQADATRPVTRGLHLAFGARSRDEVDAVWRAGTEAGFRSDGEPGVRAQYHPDYYGGFLLDPDGNSVEAVYHGVPRTGESYLDHLWVRVADLDESKRFYAAIAPALGLQIRGERDERFHVARGDRSFALVQGGAPSEHVHIAFPADGDDAVAAFHGAALAAGFRDNGGPGERGYHAGYYAAFVLDPDGNTIEAVDHHRATASTGG